MFYDAKNPLKTEKEICCRGFQPQSRCSSACTDSPAELGVVVASCTPGPVHCTATLRWLVQECCVSVWPWVQVVMRLRQGVRARAASSNREQQQPTCVWRSDQHSYVRL